MASWSYFAMALLFTMIAGVVTVMIFLLYTPAINYILNGLSTYVAGNPAANSPYNTLAFITQENLIYMGSFDFVMAGLAAICYVAAFVKQPQEYEYTGGSF